MIDFQYKSHYDVADFRRLIHLLRQKDGCPWDSVQTHHSIRNNFLEETYEVCEAIDTEDTALRLTLTGFLRGIHRFENLGELKAQIDRDSEEARRLLADWETKEK